MHVEPSIFKAYDIRGIYPGEINADVAYAIGRGFATFLLKKMSRDSMRVAVSGDMRLSSVELKQQFIRGFLDSGISVDDLGTISTPTFYYAVAYHGYDAGAQVSASHNPKEWNGFKFVGRHATPISYATGIEEIKKTIESEQYAPLVAEKERGTLQQRAGVLDTILAEQLEQIGTDFAKIKPFKIAIDASSGMGGPDMKAFFAKYPCTIVWMNEIPDGTFPAHPADPMKEENTADLRKKIVDEKCDFGIASDGDGDRYFFFDEKGELIPQEILRGILAQIELFTHIGATVVYDIRPGRITRDMIDDAGGRAVLAPVGHSLIKEIMLKEKAIFGGESSGHFFYKVPYGTFEAPFVLLNRFLHYLNTKEKSLSEIIAPYKRYFNSGEINTRLESRAAGEQKLKEIQEKYRDGAQNLIDGLSITYSDYWFSVRLSNTEPLIRLIVEATYKEQMARKRDELLALIRSEQAK